MPTESDPPTTIGDILVSSRSLAEYRAMFTLTEDDLRRRILDCPGGTASFTAEVCAAGGDVTACDPVYGQHTTSELAAMAQRESDRGNRYCRSHADDYVWTFFSDPDDHASSRGEAGRRFSDDHRAHPERYIAGGLPRLPFDDKAFDLVLRQRLADDGITTDIRSVDYEFQAGANAMLVCTRSTDPR